MERDKERGLFGRRATRLRRRAVRGPALRAASGTTIIPLAWAGLSIGLGGTPMHGLDRATMAREDVRGRGVKQSGKQAGDPMPPTPGQMETACRLLDDLAGSGEIAFRSFDHIEGLPATAAILGAGEPTRIAVARECVHRIARMAEGLGPLRGQELRFMNLYHQDGFPWEARLLLPRLLRRKLPWTSEDVAILLNRVADVRLVCT